MIDTMNINLLMILLLVLLIEKNKPGVLGPGFTDKNIVKCHVS